MRILGAGGEPRKTDGHAAANRQAILPLGFRTDVQDFFGAGGFPRSDVRSVKVNFTGGPLGGDLHARESAATIHDFSDAGNLKAPIQIAEGSRRCHGKASLGDRPGGHVRADAQSSINPVGFRVMKCVIIASETDSAWRTLIE